MRWIEEKIPLWRGLSPIWRGFATIVAAIGFGGLCLWAIVSLLAERPTPALMRYMAAIGATLLVAYAIETSTVIRADYVRSPRRESWIGGVVGSAACGLLAIACSLALAERAEVGHWTWVDEAVLAFAVMALFLLGLLVALLPVLHYEWRRQAVAGSEED